VTTYLFQCLDGEFDSFDQRARHDLVQKYRRFRIRNKAGITFCLYDVVSLGIIG